MNTSQAEQLLNSCLEANYAQIRDLKTHQVVINAMHLFAAMAVSEAKDENVSMIKGIEDKEIIIHTEAYLGAGEAAQYFESGALWMRDKILEML